MKKNIEVCLSVQQTDTYTLKEKCVVVIDVFRATTCMIFAIHQQVKEVMIFDDIEKCRKMGDKGHLLAGERLGDKIPGFDLGNNPKDYLQSGIKDKKIAMTTTNGTKTLVAVAQASQILVGSFANISLLCQYLQTQKRDVLLLCSGWQNHPNIEDTAFAGALIEQLSSDVFNKAGDEVFVATSLWNSLERKSENIISVASHAHRLLKKMDEKDLLLCTRMDASPVLAQYDGQIVSSLAFS